MASFCWWAHRHARSAAGRPDPLSHRARTRRARTNTIAGRSGPGTMVRDSLMRRAAGLGQVPARAGSGSSATGDYLVRGKLYEFGEVDTRVHSDEDLAAGGTGRPEDQPQRLGLTSWSTKSRSAARRVAGRGAIARPESAARGERDCRGDRQVSGRPKLRSPAGGKLPGCDSWRWCCSATVSRRSPLTSSRITTTRRARARCWTKPLSLRARSRKKRSASSSPSSWTARSTRSRW